MASAPARGFPSAQASARGDRERRTTESTLRLQPGGQWAVAAPGCEPVDIVAGEVFLLEVLGERRLKRVRIERRDGQWRAKLSNSGSIERRVEPRDGLKAEFFGQRERHARELN